jgi:transposase-like protein
MRSTTEAKIPSPELGLKATLLHAVHRTNPKGQRATAGACPHCSSTAHHRWGRQGASPRFRCKSCGRTFSDRTATFAHRLRRLECIPRFLEAMACSQSVRSAAKSSGISPGTAFAWRHRLIAACRSPSQERSSRGLGALQIQPLFSYTSGRKTSSHARAWIIGAHLDLRGRFGSPIRFEVLRSHSPSPHHTALDVVLGQLTSDRCELLIRGTAGARAAEVHRRRRLRSQLEGHSRVQNIGPVFRRSQLRLEKLGQSLQETLRTLRRWLTRFRGVSARYLETYLLWFRILLGSRGPSLGSRRPFGVLGYDEKGGMNFGDPVHVLVLRFWMALGAS